MFIATPMELGSGKIALEIRIERREKYGIHNNNFKNNFNTFNYFWNSKICKKGRKNNGRNRKNNGRNRKNKE